MTTELVLDATDTQAADFQANGFLRIDEITTQDEVAKLRELYDLVMQDATAYRLKYDAGADSGCMQLIPGSHRNAVVAHHCNPGEPLELDIPFDRDAAVPCPLPAGGATFHHCRTFHHTAANTSGRDRRAITTIFHAPA